MDEMKGKFVNKLNSCKAFKSNSGHYDDDNDNGDDKSK